MSRARDLADAGSKANFLDNVSADINTTFAPLASPNFTGDVNTTNLEVGTIKEVTGNTTAMQINSSGHVTRNVIPSWCLARGSNQYIYTTAQTKVLFDDQSSTSTLHLNGGCTLSSGTITVPTAGLYHMGASVRVDEMGSGYLRLQITKNDAYTGSDELYVIDGNADGTYETPAGSIIFYVTDSDISSNANNFQVYITSSGDTNYHIEEPSLFWGYLAG